MQYISTKHKSNQTGFREAVLRGMAPDNGLFFPVEIPKLSEAFFDSLKKKKIHEIAYEVIAPFVGQDIEDDVLKQLLKEALDFKIPLVQVEEDIWSLELFHGPTMAFKDVGARVTARLMALFTQGKKQTILVATSGDTGSAVANGFLGIEGVNVVVLYPKGMVSEIQEKQFATLGKNISCLEINGTFDACQALVKQAFADTELRKIMNLSSANSISIARFLPQMVYYFHAFARLKNTRKQVVFSVPSGNFGNLTAGLFAKKMGLPIDKFIAASNMNDVVPEYLKTGIFAPRPSVKTISNAMDVGNPSNFVRILELYDKNREKISMDIVGCKITDEETLEAISELYKRKGYLLDPHGAVGYEALRRYYEKHDCTGVFLETAHPAKFIDVVQKSVKSEIEIPAGLKAALDKEKLSIPMENDYNEFKNFLLKAL